MGKRVKGCVEQSENRMKDVRRLMEGEKCRNELAAHSPIKPSASLKGELAYCKLWKTLKVCLANNRCLVIFELIRTPLSVIQSLC